MFCEVCRQGMICDPHLLQVQSQLQGIWNSICIKCSQRVSACTATSKHLNVICICSYAVAAGPKLTFLMLFTVFMVCSHGLLMSYVFIHLIVFPASAARVSWRASEAKSVSWNFKTLELLQHLAGIYLQLASSYYIKLLHVWDLQSCLTSGN